MSQGGVQPYSSFIPAPVVVVEKRQIIDKLLKMQPTATRPTHASTATLQNSIVANNSGKDCGGTITSLGYNLSSDGSCKFNGPGDMNNTNPLVGPLKNNGGPTQTQALLPGSPAIDAGNPSGCTDGQGHLLKTDQRSKPRPDKEDTGGCDIGAFELQGD
jgi:hypothetical protein